MALTLLCPAASPIRYVVERGQYNAVLTGAAFLDTWTALPAYWADAVKPARDTGARGAAARPLLCAHLLPALLPPLLPLPLRPAPASSIPSIVLPARNCSGPAGQWRGSAHELCAGQRQPCRGAWPAGSVHPTHGAPARCMGPACLPWRVVLHAVVPVPSCSRLPLPLNAATSGHQQAERRGHLSRLAALPGRHPAVSAHILCRL